MIFQLNRDVYTILLTKINVKLTKFDDDVIIYHIVFELEYFFNYRFAYCVVFASKINSQIVTSNMIVACRQFHEIYWDRTENLPDRWNSGKRELKSRDIIILTFYESYVKKSKHIYIGGRRTRKMEEMVVVRSAISFITSTRINILKGGCFHANFFSRPHSLSETKIILILISFLWMKNFIREAC